MNAPPAAGDPPEPGKTNDRAAVADYLATMAANLARLARRNQLPALGHLLEMAAMEAETLAGDATARRRSRPEETD